MGENGNPDELGGWRPVVDVEGKQNIATGEGFAAGKVEMASGLQPRPCLTCRSFDNPGPKVIQFLVARGMKIGPDGMLETPIASDFPGRKPMKVDTRDLGFCAQWVTPSDIMATCERWAPKRTRGDFR